MKQLTTKKTACYYFGVLMLVTMLVLPACSSQRAHSSKPIQKPSSTLNSEKITLYDAASEGNIDIMRQLIATGSSVDEASGGFTPLAIASLVGHKNAAILLIKNGANVNLKDPKSGFPPLSFAAMKGHVPLVELLIANGASINKKGNTGRTALHTAAVMGQAAVVPLLIASGEGISATDNEGQTPLHLASEINNYTDEHQQAAVAKVLIENGANINAMNGKNRTPLLLAVVHNNNAVAELLVDQGANVIGKGPGPEVCITIFFRQSKGSARKITECRDCASSEFREKHMNDVEKGKHLGTKIGMLRQSSGKHCQ